MINDFKNSSELKWIPDGFHFLGPEESKIRRSLLEKIHSFYQGKGFLEVIPPGFDFSSSFSHHILRDEQKLLLKSNDLRVEEISPSFDLTLQIVKGMTGFAMKQGSSKLYYTGRTIRDLSTSKTGKREFFQVGAEFIGHSSGNTFKKLFKYIDELQTIMMEGRKVTIVLGNTGIFSEITLKMGLKKRERAYLTGLMYTKDRRAIIEFVNFKKLDTKFSQILTEMVLDFQPESILPGLKAWSKDLDLNILEILEETDDLVQFTQKNSSNLDLCTDFSLVRDLDYYTGFIFHGYEISSPLYTGGAYDHLFEKFSGSPKNACGFAFNLDLIEEIIRKDI